MSRAIDCTDGAGAGGVNSAAAVAVSSGRCRCGSSSSGRCRCGGIRGRSRWRGRRLISRGGLNGSGGVNGSGVWLLGRGRRCCRRHQRQDERRHPVRDHRFDCVAVMLPGLGCDRAAKREQEGDECILRPFGKRRSLAREPHGRADGSGTKGGIDRGRRERPRYGRKRLVRRRKRLASCGPRDAQGGSGRPAPDRAAGDLCVRPERRRARSERYRADRFLAVSTWIALALLTQSNVIRISAAGGLTLHRSSAHTPHASEI